MGIEIGLFGFSIWIKLFIVELDGLNFRTSIGFSYDYYPDECYIGVYLFGNIRFFYFWKYKE